METVSGGAGRPRSRKALGCLAAALLGQVRLVEVNRDCLRLSTDGPQRVNGGLKTATLACDAPSPIDQPN
jgi:hypothetical protein